MKNSAPIHTTNFFLVIFLIWIISIGCKNSDSDNTNSASEEISGEVFPANEVCKYAALPIIQKFSGFNQADSIQLGAKEMQKSILE